MIALVDLDQLIGRARPKPLPLGLRHIRIVELALKPKGRGERAFSRRLDPRLQRAAAFVSRGRFCFSHAETLEHDPKKLQTFWTRSCGKTKRVKRQTSAL